MIFIDVFTLSSWLCYSQYCASDIDSLLKPKTYIYKIPNNLDNYIKNVEHYKTIINQCEIRHQDWKTLFNEFKDLNNVCFIADPPYLTTNCNGYKNLYFGLSDTLNTIEILKTNNYLYFASNKSELIELLNALTSLGVKEIKYKIITKPHKTGGTTKPWDEYLIIPNNETEELQK